MLQFYYAPLSVNARRVWIALLEKQIPFEPIQLKLDGDQFQPEFTAISPLQRVPVIVDDGFRVVESLAILDYLEAKYPSPSFMPNDAQGIAVVRMVEQLVLNELQLATLPLTRQMVGLDVEPHKRETAVQTIQRVLQFFEDLLIQPYFMGETLTLADIVAGTLVPTMPLFGIALDAYPKLQSWAEGLSQRDSWQQTAPSPEAIQAALPSMKAILERRS